MQAGGPDPASIAPGRAPSYPQQPMQPQQPVQQPYYQPQQPQQPQYGAQPSGSAAQMAGALARRPQTSLQRPAIPQQAVYIEMSQVVGKQVITRTTGRNLGVISALWVDPVRYEVVSLDLDDKKGVGSTRISNFPLSRLTQIGDVVLVHDEEVLYDQALDGRYGYYLLTGMEVRTRSGEFLGKVRDFTFSPDNGAIARVVYDDFGLSFLPVAFFDTYSIAMTDVISMGVGGLIVTEEARYRERRESPGLFAAIPSLLRSLNSGTGRVAGALTDGYRQDGVAGYLPQGYSYTQWEADVRRWEQETGMSYDQYTRMKAQQQQPQLGAPRSPYTASRALPAQSSMASPAQQQNGYPQQQQQQQQPQQQPAAGGYGYGGGYGGYPQQQQQPGYGYAPGPSGQRPMDPRSRVGPQQQMGRPGPAQPAQQQPQQAQPQQQPGYGPATQQPRAPAAANQAGWPQQPRPQQSGQPQPQQQAPGQQQQQQFAQQRQANGVPYGAAQPGQAQPAQPQPQPQPTPAAGTQWPAAAGVSAPLERSPEPGQGAGRPSVDAWVGQDGKRTLEVVGDSNGWPAAGGKAQ